MTTPDERDLARFLLDELEMQLVERPPSDRSWRALGRRLSQSRLWPLQSDRPLGAMLTSDQDLAASVVRQAPVDLRDELFPVTMRRAADGVHLAFSDLPPEWQPICIVIATFAWSPFERADTEVSVPQTAELAAKRQRDLRPGVSRASFAEAATPESFDLSAHDGSWRTGMRQHPGRIPESLDLSADDGSLVGGEGDEQGVVEFTSPDLRCLYHRAEALVEVTARLPLDEELHHGVAELSYRDGNSTVVQRQPLVFKFRVRDQWKASALLPVPDSTEDGIIRIGVRPFTDQDLDLLPPAEVTDVLGSRLITSMPLEPIADGFVFRPTMEHHRIAMQDANACWCIRMAIGEEGEDEA